MINITENFSLKLLAIAFVIAGSALGAVSDVKPVYLALAIPVILIILLCPTRKLTFSPDHLKLVATTIVPFSLLIVCLFHLKEYFTDSERIAERTGESLIQIILITSFFVPVVEEFIFRLGLIELLRKFGVIISLIVSAAIFGLVHSNFLMPVIVGLYLGFLYITSNSMTPGLIIHMGQNLSAGIFNTYLINRWQMSDAAQFYLIMFPNLVLCQFVVLGLFISFQRGFARFSA